MRVVLDDCWCCVDCLRAIANGDYPEDPDACAAVERGLASFDGDVVLGGPHEDEDEGADTLEFSWSACDCCGSTLGGERHRFAVLGPAE